MNKKTKESKKLKDLIRIGVFSALWIALGFAISSTMGYFPPVFLVLPCILAFIGSVIIFVMLSKLTIPGGIAIPPFLYGLLLFSMVPYGLLFFFPCIGGVIGELVYRAMGRNKFKSTVIALCFPMLGFALGEYIPMNFMQDAFRAQYADSVSGSDSLGEVFLSLFSTPLIIILSVATLLVTWLGCLWGKRIVEKRLASKSAASTNE